MWNRYAPSNNPFLRSSLLIVFLSVNTENPCTDFSQQYFALPGNPNCYIQCAFNRMFVKPCPGELTWNAAIDACDWPIAEGEIDSSSQVGDSSGRDTGSSAYYGRKKRSALKRNKRFFGFGPPIIDPVPTQVPLGETWTTVDRCNRSDRSLLFSY
jgi:hypothetical protein